MIMVPPGLHRSWHGRYNELIEAAVKEVVGLGDQILSYYNRQPCVRCEGQSRTCENCGTTGAAAKSRRETFNDLDYCLFFPSNDQFLLHEEAAGWQASFSRKPTSTYAAPTMAFKYVIWARETPRRTKEEREEKDYYGSQEFFATGASESPYDRKARVHIDLDFRRQSTEDYYLDGRIDYSPTHPLMHHLQEIVDSWSRKV